VTGDDAVPARRGGAGGRRRVLVLLDAYWNPHGGTEGQVLALLERLPPRYEAEVWVVHHSPWLERHAFPVPHRNLEIRSMRRLAHLRRLPGLVAEARRRRFDLVVTYMGDASLLGPLLGARLGVPVLVSRRDLGFWHTPAVVSALRRTGRLATAFVANAEAVKRHVVEAEGVAPDRVRVVRNGVDLARFEGGREPGLRARHGIPDDAVLVGLLANLKPLKRQADLVDALARLSRRHPRLRALFVGGGPRDELLARAGTAGVLDRVHVVHARGDALGLLRECDVAVLCSESEGLSNAVLEAMGCGLPVVATAVGGNPELVEDGVTGFLYEVGDVEALARRLDGLLRDDAARARLGAAGRAVVATRFGVERMVGETLALWDEALAPPRPGPPPPRVEVVTDVAALPALEGAWRAAMRPGQLFVGPDWATAWLSTAEPGVRPSVLVARDAAGAPMGFLPLARRGGTLEPCGAGAGADHVDVVAREGEARAVAEAMLDALLALPWRRLLLRHLAEDGALRAAVAGRRWRVPYAERLATVCPYVEARGDFAAYLGRFSAKHRGNLRRQARAFRDDPDAAVERVSSPAEAGPALERLFDLHERRFAARGVETSFRGERVRAFHRALAASLAARGELSLAFLRVGGRDLAAHYGFRQGGRLHHFQGGFDPEARAKSPGTALATIVLEEDVFGAGLHELDFLDGGEAYKASFATGVRRLYDLEVFRPTPWGRARALARGALRMVREARAG
jgi:glycosyltransferase involved in cell wall biosynthesis/CelD/BcsL family acetyltransferase involved in cellulose biosynthesis